MTTKWRVASLATVGLALGLFSSASAVAADLDGPPARMTVAAAKALAPILVEDVESTISIAALKPRTACKSRSRTRVVCVTAWSVGDSSYRATTDLRRTGTFGSPTDRYTITVRYLNAYSGCTRRCRSTERASGVRPTGTRRAYFGQSLTATSNEGQTVRVTARLGQDPAPPSAYEEPAAGGRYLTVLFDVANRRAVPATSTFEVPLFGSEAALILADNTTIQGKSIDAVAGCDNRLVVPDGEARTACVVFEVPYGAAIHHLELAWGIGWAEQYQWHFRP